MMKLPKCLCEKGSVFSQGSEYKVDPRYLEAAAMCKR